MKFLRHHLKISLLTIFFLALTAGLAYAQNGLTFGLRSGSPATLPADGDSRTALVVYVPVDGPCWLAAKQAEAAGEMVTLEVNLSTTGGTVLPGSLDYSLDESPVPRTVTLVAGTEPGPVVVTAEMTYCLGGVMTFGVCSSPDPNDSGSCSDIVNLTFTDGPVECGEGNEADFWNQADCPPTEEELAQQEDSEDLLCSLYGDCPPENPDSDSDGLPDADDACPYTPADTGDGCPLPDPTPETDGDADSDGDGLPDDEDGCPTLAADTGDGCPPVKRDSDGDGLTDDEDDCPHDYARTADGCPLPIADADGDGIPDDEDDCPDEPAADAADGCPQAIAAVDDETPPDDVKDDDPPDQTPAPPPSPDLLKNLEEFLAGQGVEPPTPGQAAAGAAGLSALLAAWVITNMASGFSQQELLQAIQFWRRQTPLPPPAPPETAPPQTAPPSDVPERPAEADAAPSDANPDDVRLLQTTFNHAVNKLIDQDKYVMNRNFVRKSWNWSLGGLANKLQGYTGGQCQQFAEWGNKLVTPAVKRIFGPDAIVDNIVVREQSSLNPQGLSGQLDALVEANHIATRVILPTGERYVLDFWQAVGDSQDDLVGDAVYQLRRGSPKPAIPPRLIPEDEWTRKWLQKIGQNDSYVDISHNQQSLKSEVELALRKYQHGGFGLDSEADALQLAFDKFCQSHPDVADTLINSWRRQPW